MGGGDDVVGNVFPDIPEGQVAGGLGEDLLQIDVHGQIVADLDREVMVKDHGRRTHLAVSGFEDADVVGPPGVPAGDGRGQRAVPADQRLRLRRRPPRGRRPPDRGAQRHAARSRTPAGRRTAAAVTTCSRGSSSTTSSGAAPAPPRAFGHDGRDICDAEVRVDCEAR